MRREAAKWDTEEMGRKKGGFSYVANIPAGSNAGGCGGIVIPISLILYTPMIEAIHFFEMSVVTKVTRRHIPENGILHSDRRENLKSYIALTGLSL
jgi:hypothetical protein